MTEEPNRPTLTPATKELLCNVASHALYFVLLLALAFVILDPYDAVGGGIESFPKACLVLGGFVMPAVMGVCWIIRPLSFTGLLLCNGVVAAGLMTWAIRLGNAFKISGSMSLMDYFEVIMVVFLVMLPFVGVQCAWLGTFRWVLSRRNSNRTA